MDPASLIIPFLQTSTELISPTPLPPPSNPTLIPSLITPDSQNIPMSGVVRNKAGAGAQPPRPPNAWILYRSDKLQELPPPPVGQSKLTQAQVSKIIAAEWKKEPEEVRNFYEQRAEKAKAEHARLYPNYRFAPMKKVDRDRIREERRQAKELERVGRRVRGRVAPYPPPTTSSTTFNLPGPLIIKHVLPHAPSASPTISSHSSSSSATLLEQPRVSVEPFLGSTRVSPNASPDLHFPFVDLQDPPSHESSPLGDTPPSETSQPAFLLRPMHPPSLPNPPRGWNPSSSDPPTTFIDPSQDVSLPDWLQTLPQIPKQIGEADLWYTMPYYDNLALQESRNVSTLASLYGTGCSSAFQQGSVNDGLFAPPPGTINISMGTYPSPLCGSTAFDYPLRVLGEDPEMFMSNPTAEQLLAAINTLTQSQLPENISPPSSDLAPIDPAHAFNFDDFVKDFGGPASLEHTDGAPTLQSRGEEQSTATVDLSPPPQSSSGTPSLRSHSQSVDSPMPSFYVATSPPASRQPTPPSPAPKHPYVPPRGAANSSARRVGGSWKVPMAAVSRLASPIPSCAASPNQVVA